MNNLDLLSTNKFVPTGVYNLSDDKHKEEYLRKQMEFRQYMENKMSKFTMGGDGFKNDLDLDDLSNTNAIDFKVQPNPASEVKKSKSKTENRQTSVSVDSRDRNSKKYIDANKYIIKLNKAFVNVNRVSLKSTEFPNTQQLIRASPAAIANNVIAWQNKTDTINVNSGIPDESSGYITYKTSIEAGNYDASTLQKKIQENMNAVSRKVYTVDTSSNVSTTLKNHTFTITVDPITDKTEITSVEFDNFSNVLHTKEGEKYIFFANKTDDAGEVLAVHSLKTGARIFIKDANDIGGIDDSEINGEHVITQDNIINGVSVWDGSSTAKADTIYYFSTSTKASLSVSYAGGTAVKIGTGIQFRLKWDLDNTLASVIGYNNEMYPTKLYNKIYLTDGVTPNTDYKYEASTSNPLKVTMTTNSDVCVIERENGDFTNGSQSLANDENIHVDNWPEEQPVGGLFPNNIDSVITNNSYTVTVLAANKLQFVMPNRATSNETKTFNGQIHKVNESYVPLTIYELQTIENFALVVDNTKIKSRLNIYKVSRYSDTKTSVHFTSDHDLIDGDKVFLDFDGLYGYTGTAEIRDDSQIKASSEVSNPGGYVVEKIDSSAVSIPLAEFPVDSTWQNVWDVAFESYSYSQPQSDQKYGEGIIKVLSKGINLDGENYIYMCVDQFPAMTVSSSVSNVFYKIILNGSPGTTLYNTFVGNAFQPKDGLIPKLEFLNIAFKTQDNELFQFNNAEHSFTLEVTEVVDMPDTSGMSSRRGK